MAVPPLPAGALGHVQLIPTTAVPWESSQCDYNAEQRGFVIPLWTLLLLNSSHISAVSSTKAFQLK